MIQGRRCHGRVRRLSRRPARPNTCRPRATIPSHCAARPWHFLRPKKVLHSARSAQPVALHLAVREIFGSAPGSAASCRDDVMTAPTLGRSSATVAAVSASAWSGALRASAVGTPHSPEPRARRKAMLLSTTRRLENFEDGTTIGCAKHARVYPTYPNSDRCGFAAHRGLLTRTSGCATIRGDQNAQAIFQASERGIPQVARFAGRSEAVAPHEARDQALCEWLSQDPSGSC